METTQQSRGISQNLVAKGGNTLRESRFDDNLRCLEQFRDAVTWGGEKIKVNPTVPDGLLREPWSRHLDEPPVHHEIQLTQINKLKSIVKLYWLLSEEKQKHTFLHREKFF